MILSTSTILVFLLGLMNGTTLLASRFSVGQYSTSNYLTIRLAIASVVYAVLVWFTQKDKLRFFPKSKKFWIGSLFVGFLTGISMNAIIMAMQYISSGLNSILMTITPALTVLMAHFMLNDERLSFKKIIGIVLALAGVFFMMASGESGLPNIDVVNPLGYVLSLIGIVVSSYSSIVIRKKLAEFDAVHVATVRNFGTLVVSVLLSLLIFGFDFSRVNSIGVGVLLYAAVVGTFAAHLLNVHINQKYGATTISVTNYIIPIVSNIGGVILLDEEITWVTSLGMLLIIGGIFVMNNVLGDNETGQY